mgnify:FL=1
MSIQFRLFNNAGVDFAKAFEQTEANDWVRVVDTDLRGVCLCARRVVLEMLKSGGGVIVDIAFVHSIAGLPVAADADECLNFWKSNIPMRRVGKPEEIANPAVFLASDKASYVCHVRRISARRSTTNLCDTVCDSTVTPPRCGTITTLSCSRDRAING